ncbi:MAG: hypothetical protein ACRDZM_17465 [Acidimicrobiia bacterium]
MEAELYQKFRNSPIRTLLRQVAANPKMPVRDDTLDALSLGAREREALTEAVEQIRGEQALNARQRHAEKAAAIIVESAGLDHETVAERTHRRASEGDPTARATVADEKAYFEEMADRIHRKGL